MSCCTPFIAPMHEEMPPCAQCKVMEHLHPGDDECCRDVPRLVCCCRQSIMSSESGHPCASAAGKLSLTTDQVSRGLLYRQRMLGVLDRFIPWACHCAGGSYDNDIWGHASSFPYVNARIFCL